jgi:hypothetical protein
VITYDGASDCDENHTARWSRDGIDMGAIEGVTCAAGRGSAGGAIVMLLALLVVCSPTRVRRAR